tara:strand:+ start:433 stop:1314 length:882 start_codon:yes stop_codon:yes gene_type:complete
MFINFPIKPILIKNRPQIINIIMSTKKPNYNPIIGSNIGIPLNILQYIYTTTYYGESVINIQLFFLQFAIGIFTYGSDRFYDALEYNNTKLDNTKLNNTKLNNTKLDNNNIYSIEKINYYENVLYNYNNNIYFIFLSYIYILYVLLPHINTYPLLIALTSTLDYKNFKKHFGQFKALYIGVFWTLGCLVLPCILISDDYSILNDPTLYLPSFFLMFGSSNLLDIKDIDEDASENINTLPVLYGENIAIALSHSALLIAIILFFQNENFDNNLLLSSLYELQIFGSFFLNYKKE